MLRLLATACRPRYIQRRHASSVASLMRSLLPSNYQSIVDEEKKLLIELHQTLHEMGASKETLQLVKDIRSRINDLYTVVVVGEYNSGKSSVLNCLNSNPGLCKVGILPTTGKICIIRYDRTDKHRSNESDISIGIDYLSHLQLEDVEEIVIQPTQDNSPTHALTNPGWLHNVVLIDTPGTNALYQHHEALTQQIVPHADLIVFLTSAERPISESEAKFLNKIKQWNKKILVVVNKIDTLPSPQEKKQVMDYVTNNTNEILDINKKLTTDGPLSVYGISARQALEAKLLLRSNPDDAAAMGLWKASEFEKLESYLQSVLGSEELIRTKLDNILQVSNAIIADCLTSMSTRGESLQSDIRGLEMVQETMNQFNQDMHRDSKYFIQSIHNLCDQSKKRMADFIDARVSLFNYSLLLDKQQFAQEFERDVNLSLNQPINDLVVELSGLLTQRARIQAKSVIEYIGNRPLASAVTKKSLPFLGALPFDSEFEKIRYELVDKLKRDTGHVLFVHGDNKQVVDKINNNLKNSLMITASLQTLSAVGIGGLLATTMDVTGILAASTIGIFSFFLLPMQRNQTKQEYSNRINTLQSQLVTVVTNSFNNELESCNNKIKSAIGPYSTFVNSENDKLKALTSKLNEYKKTVHGIKGKIS